MNSEQLADIRHQYQLSVPYSGDVRADAWMKTADINLGQLLAEVDRLAEALAAAEAKVAAAYDEGWNEADEEAVQLTGVRLPVPQRNPYRETL